MSKLLNMGACVALFILISGCCNAEESVKLVCTGVETTTVGKNNSVQSKPDIRDITKTIILNSDTRKIIKGLKITKGLNITEQKDRTEEYKKVYILNIDGQRELYEESSIDIFFDKTTQFSANVTVKNEKILGASELSISRINDSREKSYESFGIEIDRFSGAYKERLQQSFQSGKEVFFVEIIGTCKKAERKF